MAWRPMLPRDSSSEALAISFGLLDEVLELVP